MTSCRVSRSISSMRATSNLPRSRSAFAALRQRLGGGDLDIEPDAEPVLRRPNGAHLGAGITGDHGRVGSAGSAVLPGVKDMRTSSTRIKAYYKAIRSARYRRHKQCGGKSWASFCGLA